MWAVTGVAVNVVLGRCFARVAAAASRISPGVCGVLAQIQAHAEGCWAGHVIVGWIAWQRPAVYVCFGMPATGAAHHLVRAQQVTVHTKPQCLHTK